MNFIKNLRKRKTDSLMASASKVNTYSGQMPLVSVLVPCYNSRKTLKATLQSLRRSEYKSLDVMIVDDGSIDKVEDIVLNFNDSRFRYFWKENEGLGLTRNFGINNARGKYIFFLDSDDLIYPDSLTNLVNFALNENVDVVSGVTVRKIFETGLESEWFRSIYKEKYVSTLNNRLPLFNDTLSTNKLYSVSILKEKNIYFNTGLYEDKLFTAQLYSSVDRIGIIDNRVYIWLIYGNQTSITTSKTLDNFKGRMLAINNLWKYLPELRKAHQIAFYMNHDLLIYLREFMFYTELEKKEIFKIAADFINKNKKYVYKRFITATVNSACLEALLKNNEDSFIFTANGLSIIYQEEIKRKARV